MVNRGRKGSDKRAVVQQLEYLTRAARKLGPRKEIPLLMHLIAAILDSHRSIDDYVDIVKWGTCHRSLMRIVGMLLADEKLVLSLTPLSDVTEQPNADLVKEPVKEEEEVNPNLIKVVGSLEAFLLRLELEYKKSLQQINPHTSVSPFKTLLLPFYSTLVSFPRGP